MELSAAFEHAVQLHQRRDYGGALRLYDEALTQDSKNVAAYFGKAEVLNLLQRHDEAMTTLSRLLALQPTSVEALMMRGQCRISLQQLERAFEDFDLAAALDPDAKYAQGTVLYLAMRLCRWEGFDAAVADLVTRVEAGDAVAKPFHLMAVPASWQQHRACAATYYAATEKTESPRPTASSGDKITLGYFSSDFRAHATSHLMAGLLRHHDRSKFEVVAFSLTHAPHDPVQRQVKASVDRWIDISGMSDEAVVNTARAAGIHIALDLNVHLHRQPAFFARGVAPIQVGYLGFPGTSAADCYDYIIGDPVVTPLEDATHFSERIVMLPHTYQATDFREMPSLPTPSRAELGLPANAFVFCSFNDNFKITPDVFDVWMRLLRSVEGSVLWLLALEPVAVRNLQREADARGVSSDRLIFAPRAPLQDHIARIAAADLFLDTFPCTAHTTASDALWAGLPVLTRQGETFVSRVAASLLMAADLPELITRDSVEYEQRARELALNPAELSRLRTRLVENRMTCALFDTERYARNLETAYVEMWRRCRDGRPTDHIVVSEAH